MDVVELTLSPRALVTGGSVSSFVGLERLLNAWLRQDAATAQLPFAIGLLFAMGGILLLGAAAVVARTGRGRR
jgi:hypothetical protein